MSCRQRDNQVAIINRQRSCRADQTTIRSACKFGDRSLYHFASRPPSGVNSTPNDGATDWMAANWPTLEVTVGSRMTPTRVMRGEISFRSSSHFVPMPYSKFGNPVMLPPGFPRLETKPAVTGSATITNTIGKVRVASCNAATDGVAVAKMTSRGFAANSVAAFRKSAVVQRYSICKLRPSLQPNLCNS